TRALRATGAPVVVVLHELAPDWTGRGWRGAMQSAAQRAALVPILRCAAAAVVTAEHRVAELQRPWLPRRRVELVPLPSNVPVRPASARNRNGRLRIGVFGFRHETLQAELATRAVATLGERATLVLVGAP